MGVGEASLPSCSPGDGPGRLPRGASRQRGPLGPKLGRPGGELMEKMAEFSTGFLQYGVSARIVLL